MGRCQVYPPHLLDPVTVRYIRDAVPDLLFIRHPTFEMWQAYWSREGQWDAERLYRAIATHSAHKRNPEWAWWKWRGAPLCVGQFKAVTCGVVDEMRRRRMDHYPGGHRQWIRDLEETERMDEEARMRVVSDMNHDAVYGGFYRHARDFVHGDPLAGKRRWVHTSPGIVATTLSDGSSLAITHARRKKART